MAINKHGLKMVGLKKASGATRNYGYYGNFYVQIAYDLKDGKIVTAEHTKNSYTKWVDGVIHVCNTSKRMTMQEIADAVNYVMLYYKSLADCERGFDR